MVGKGLGGGEVRRKLGKRGKDGVVQAWAVKVVAKGVRPAPASESAFGVAVTESGVGGPSIGPSFKDVQGDEWGHLRGSADGDLHLGFEVGWGKAKKGARNLWSLL